MQRLGERGPPTAVARAVKGGPSQFRRGELAEVVRERNSGIFQLDPRFLEIELTEAR